ncbi:heat repeat-containing protein [Nitzschia inconspicua]|uniref:Deoxyhypusine hydroxylase n=1 Tax=Nitzschia inconspicua TaxID=303405 RepID=A0A9K3M2F3_9STRA|nr:heat repeat-containing protein [Nitzschia inconspicua]
MWTIPSLEDIEDTLRDPQSPIGKRMRAAYYAKQLFLDEQKRIREDEMGEKKEKDAIDDDDDDDDEEEDTNNNNNNNSSATAVSSRILQVLCDQVFVKEHGSLLRHEFAYVLGQMQTEQACQALETLLQKDDDCVMVRHEAAEALGAIASTTSISALQDTQTKYQGICNELADTCRLALNRIRQQQQQQQTGSNNHLDTTVVGCACMMAPYNSVDPAAADPDHVNMTTTQLGDLLLDSTASLIDRYRAMFSLRNRGGVDAVQQLCRSLMDDTSSPLLRHEVAFVLGQLQHPASIDALEQSLSRLDEHTMVRHESAEALGAIDVASAEEWQRIEAILTKYQQDDDPAVAESCIVALDAADYFNNNNIVTTTTSSSTEDVDEIDQLSNNFDDSNNTSPTAPMSFGQQKHDTNSNCKNSITINNDGIRKQLLAEHFNVVVVDKG